MVQPIIQSPTDDDDRGGGDDGDDPDCDYNDHNDSDDDHNESLIIIFALNSCHSQFVNHISPSHNNTDLVIELWGVVVG